MTQKEENAYWKKLSRATPVPEKGDVWAQGVAVRVVLSIGQDMDVTYTETGLQGVQLEDWNAWVQWVNGGSKSARLVGKVVRE